MIGKLLRKKEPHSLEIGFDELTAWLELRYGKLSDDLGKHAASVYPNVEHALGEIKKSTVLLEEAKPEGRFHLKMVKTATSNRDNMVKQLRMLIDNINVPETTDVRAISDFYERAMQSLAVCLENMMRSHQYTKMVFLEESKHVIADVNILGRLLNRLIEPINYNKQTLDAFENARNAIRAIKDTLSAIEIEEKTIRADEEKAILLKNELDEKQRALSELKESENWKQCLNYRNELVQLENKAEHVESEIIALVLPLNKALIRLLRLGESGRYNLKPYVRDGINLCLSDPKSANPEFLVEFRSIAESGALNLTQEKQDKLLEQIKLAVSSLDSYQKRYQALVLDIEKKKYEISKSINGEETNLIERIAALQHALAESEKEFETSKKHIVSLKHGLELKKQELQQVVLTIDSRTRVSFPNR